MFRPQASERIRVEILSLSLRPECQVARDSSVVRLFVEYSLLDLPTEETPLSLPKPPRGKSINYNYSKGKNLLMEALQPYFTAHMQFTLQVSILTHQGA